MARIYGRVTNPDGTKTWVVVQTDANGFNDAVNCTWLCQALLLNLNESPFYSDWGIPAKSDIVQQVQPDYYVTRTQMRFAQYFANLLVAKVSSNPPIYNISIATHAGAKVNIELNGPQ